MKATDASLRLLLCLCLLCAALALLHRSTAPDGCASERGTQRQRELHLTLMNIEVLGLTVCDTAATPAGSEP